MAKQQKKSVSSLAKELILEALERCGDMVLSDIAQVRDKEKAKRVAHHEAGNKLYSIQYLKMVVDDDIPASPKTMRNTIKKL